MSDATDENMRECLLQALSLFKRYKVDGVVVLLDYERQTSKIGIAVPDDPDGVDYAFHNLRAAEDCLQKALAKEQEGRNTAEVVMDSDLPETEPWRDDKPN